MCLYVRRDKEDCLYQTSDGSMQETQPSDQGTIVHVKEERGLIQEDKYHLVLLQKFTNS